MSHAIEEHLQINLHLTCCWALHLLAACARAAGSKKVQFGFHWSREPRAVHMLWEIMFRSSLRMLGIIPPPESQSGMDTLCTTAQVTNITW